MRRTKSYNASISAHLYPAFLKRAEGNLKNLKKQGAVISPFLSASGLLLTVKFKQNIHLPLLFFVSNVGCKRYF